MLLYDKKNSSIDVYTMKPNNEKIKKYKKDLLKNNGNLFYSFRTNYYEIMNTFKKTKEFKIFNINNYFKIEKMVDISNSNKNIQSKIIEDYINGKYNYICPTKTFVINKNNYLEKDVYYFLESQKIEKKSSNNTIYEINNLLNLPQKLFLLHLLEQGRFKDLENKDIDDLLELFDISFSKSISLDDYDNIISTNSNMNKKLIK